MGFNFNGQTTIINSQIGDNNTAYYNSSLTENDWKSIENIFNQLLKEMNKDSDLYDFFKTSKKYISIQDAKELKKHFKKNCNEFVKNVFYNITSTGIISLLSKIGIFI